MINDSLCRSLTVSILVSARSPHVQAIAWARFFLHFPWCLSQGLVDPMYFAVLFVYYKYVKKQKNGEVWASSKTSLYLHVLVWSGND